MPKKRVLIIVITILAVAILGAGIWIWQKSATPSVPAPTSLTPQETRKEILAALVGIEQKLQNGDVKIQAEVVVPDYQKAVSTGMPLVTPGERVTFLPQTLSFKDVYAIVESKIGKDIFIVRLIKLDGQWYVSGTQPKD